MSLRLTFSFKGILIVGLLFFIITAIFSVGYFNPDEHFQILEFSNYKLGNTPAKDLPWEFSRMMRPALQPFISTVFIRCMNFIGIYNPFTYAFVFRTVSALLAWFIFTLIIQSSLKDFTSEISRKYLLLFTFFLWFVPLISVRFTSENYAGLSLLGAIYFINRYFTDEMNPNPFHLIPGGLLLGFSFFFRFQIGFAIIGVILWTLVIKKISWKNLIVFLASSLAAIVLCIFIDYWFYGEFVLTPINYFKADVIDEKAPGWVANPWWYYLSAFTIEAVPPVSIILIVFFLVGIYKRPKSIFTWAIIPFLIAHFLVGNKQLRFLIPVVFMFIYLSASGFEVLIKYIRDNKLLKYLFGSALVLNCIMLCFILFIPSQTSYKYYRFLYRYASEKEVVMLCEERSAYEMMGLNVNFYKPENLSCHVFQDDEELFHYLYKNESDTLLVLERDFFSDLYYPGYKSETVYCLLPQWMEHLNVNNWIDRAGIWKIKELTKITEE